jgi:alginate O-acetyltransferase complex protein AlgI
MAIGLSRIIGYELKPNFNLPFITSNISDFWNRWHMTLTAWLQTYLFNPLAVHFRRRMARMPKDFRKKHKLLPESAAAVITFLISGIWHGVGFNFAIFGLLHGVFYVIQKLFAQYRKKSGKPSWGTAGRVISILANFLLINLIQVFFRTETVGKAAAFYRALFTPHAGVSFMSFWCIAGFVLLGAATLAAFVRQRREGLPEPEGYYPLQDLGTVRGLTLLFMVAGLALLLGYFGDTFFVYEQF